MSRKLPSNNILVQFLIILVITTNTYSHVLAEVNKEVLPKNAIAKTYGSVKLGIK